MGGLRKSDPPARRKLALIRRGDTESTTSHTIGGVARKQGERRKPSMPKMPWERDAADQEKT